MINVKLVKALTRQIRLCKWFEQNLFRMMDRINKINSCHLQMTQEQFFQQEALQEDISWLNCISITSRKNTRMALKL